MTSFQRRMLRLRALLLRSYELFLYALLVAMAVLAALPGSSSASPDDPLQCGKNQSSPVVITR